MRNSRLGGDYGDEEKDGGFPFEANKVYEIGIQVQEETYKVRNSLHSQTLNRVELTGPLNLPDVRSYHCGRVW